MATSPAADVGDERPDVLDRPRLRTRNSTDDARMYVEVISIPSNQVADPLEIAVATRDADDAYLVALARQPEAVWIVTGDDDILDWDEPITTNNRAGCVREVASRTDVNCAETAWSRTRSIVSARM